MRWHRDGPESGSSNSKSSSSGSGNSSDGGGGGDGGQGLNPKRPESWNANWVHPHRTLVVRVRKVCVNIVCPSPCPRIVDFLTRHKWWKSDGFLFSIEFSR